MLPPDQLPYQTTSAVLLVIFNRPVCTKRVFAAIREARPKLIYIAADGPRADIAGDVALCAQAREIINQVDWDCEIKTLLRDENVGCRSGVSSAATWFFEHEEEGIILEDDTLPADSFFKFCDILLEKYRDDTRIRLITGHNPQQQKKWGDGSYYFSNLTHVWGWASWQRVWNDYDPHLTKYNADEARQQLSNIFADPLVVDSWARIFGEVKAGKINAWGYQFDFANFFNNGLTIVPNQNLISNIGFGADATHTLDLSSIYANAPVTEIGELIHPAYILPSRQADMFVLNRDFDIDKKRKKEKQLSTRIKIFFKSLFH